MSVYRVNKEREDILPTVQKVLCVECKKRIPWDEYAYGHDCEEAE